MKNGKQTKNELIEELQSTQNELKKLKTKFNKTQKQLNDLESTDSERTTAENALRDSEDRFRNVVNNVLEYIYSTEYKNGEIKSTYHSPRCKDITGYSSEEYQKNPGLRIEIVPEEDKELIYKFYRDLDDNLNPATIEHRIIHKNGQIQWVSNTCSIQVDDETVREFGFIFDITDRKLTEEALRKSEEHYRQLTENTTDVIWKMNLNLKLTYISPSITSLTGFTPEEISYLKLNQLLTPDSYKQIYSFIQGEIQNINKWPKDELRSKIFVMEIYRKDKTTTWTENTVSFIIDESKNLLGYQGVTRDITKRLEAEEELKILMAELKQSNKELQEYAYIISHDLNEPLRMVASYLQLLQRRYKNQLDEDADEFIEYAVSGSFRMKRMIKDLLNYSRVGTSGVDIKLTSVDHIMDQVVSNLQILIENNNAIIQYDILPEIYADETQLIRLLQNLIENAIKFHGKTIPYIEISAKRDKELWEFSIKDNGVGFKQEYADKIFRIFQRLNKTEKYTGSGIGLSICKKIVELHGGKLWVKSEENSGSTFYFTIPVIKDNTNEQ